MRWLYIPDVILLWPLIWWDRRERIAGRKPDKWYWADAYLCSKGWFIKTGL